MRAFALSAALLLTACCISNSQPRLTGELKPLPRGLSPQAVLQQSLEYVFPELIIGGEWTSTIRLANVSTKSIPTTTVYFLDNTGAPMKAQFQAVTCTTSAGCQAGNPITDYGFTFFLSPGGIIEATFFGGSSTQFGHAVIDFCSTSSGCSSAGLYAQVTLRNSNPTRPDFESVFPLEQPAPLQYMLWDHRNGLTTTLYLVNENTTSTTVTLTCTNPLGQTIGTYTLTLPSLASQILALHAVIPASIGQSGGLTISGSNSSSVALITATGLRINPSNSFTPLRAFIPAK